MAVYKISGMSCEGCVQKVNTVLEKLLPGGATIKVILNDGTVMISNAEIADADVRQAVEDAGFGFKGRVSG